MSMLNGLQTEGRNPKSANIDTVSTIELCRIINNEDSTIAAAVERCLPRVAAAIDCLSDRVRRGGRVIYVGAGTSGRLGVLDASEIPPTYSAPVGQFVGLIAGGDVALRSAKEGAEDSLEAGIEDLERIHVDGEKDSLIGIASSGRTPYVLSCLDFAKSKGCATVGIACTSPSELGQRENVDFLIEALTGPEVVTGSTRMKAGTATKLVLNMISTGIMIRLGKTFGNIMVDVKPTNIKLEHRARRIIREIIGPECRFSDDELDDALARCGKSVKLAAVMLKLQVSVEEARSRLEGANGVIGTLFKQPSVVRLQNGHGRHEAVICVDAGGSRCRATVLYPDGIHGTGEAGPCNVSEVGSKSAVREIKLSIKRAIENCSPKPSLSTISVLSAWVGIAGGDRIGSAQRLQTELAEALPRVESWRVSNDLELLATVVGGQTALNDMVVLICGTGSIAMRYRRQGSNFVQLARAGGWGPLLGDDGSGFDIGRQAIRYALKHVEDASYIQAGNTLKQADPLVASIVDHYRPSDNPYGDDYDLLSSILLGESTETQSPSQTKRGIASCAHLVVQPQGTIPQAAAISGAAQQNLVDLVKILFARSGGEHSDSVLVLAGGVMQSETFRDGLTSMMVSNGLRFRDIKLSGQLTLEGARYLQRSR